MFDSRPVTDEDAVLGVRPRYVVEPSTVAEAAAVMRVAHEEGMTVVPRGNGTRLRWGAAPRACDVVIDTRKLDRVIEHASGDLVVTVEAGLPVRALQDVLRTTGQQLALDSPLPSTVGGLVATAAAGPRRLLYGAARDLLIGVTVVRADGTIVKSGGKVVKNVAGYDLGKLYTGSFGTLGLIVRASFRLHPLPEQQVYVTTDGRDPARRVQALLHGSLVPSAIEVDGDGTVAALFEGTAAWSRAEDAVELLGAGASASGTPPAWWGRYPEGDVLLEVQGKPTDLTGLLTVRDTWLRGSAGSGIWFLGTSAEAAPRVVAKLREHLPTVVRQAPLELHETLDLWGPTPALSLMRRVKDQFDPDHRLSPGRFIGGI